MFRRWRIYSTRIRHKLLHNFLGAIYATGGGTFPSLVVRATGFPFSGTDPNFATACCKIGKDSYSRANRIIYPMFLSENPFTSGISFRISFARRGMIPAPHPLSCCRSCIIRPMSQYMRIISALAERLAFICACRMRALTVLTKSA